MNFDRLLRKSHSCKCNFHHLIKQRRKKLQPPNNRQRRSLFKYHAQLLWCAVHLNVPWKAAIGEKYCTILKCRHRSFSRRRRHRVLIECINQPYFMFNLCNTFHSPSPSFSMRCCTLLLWAAVPQFSPFSDRKFHMQCTDKFHYSAAVVAACFSSYGLCLVCFSEFNVGNRHIYAKMAQFVLRSAPQNA